MRPFPRHPPAIPAGTEWDEHGYCAGHPRSFRGLRPRPITTLGGPPVSSALNRRRSRRTADAAGHPGRRSRPVRARPGSPVRGRRPCSVDRLTRSARDAGPRTAPVLRRQPACQSGTRCPRQARPGSASSAARSAAGETRRARPRWSATPRAGPRPARSRSAARVPSPNTRRRLARTASPGVARSRAGSSSIDGWCRGGELGGLRAVRHQRVCLDDVERHDGQPAPADRPRRVVRPGEQRVPHDRLGPASGRRDHRRLRRARVRPPRPYLLGGITIGIATVAALFILVHAGRRFPTPSRSCRSPRT